jgi:hypothetical protein
MRRRKEFLVQGTSEHGFVGLLQLEQGEPLGQQLKADRRIGQLAAQAFDRHAQA